MKVQNSNPGRRRVPTYLMAALAILSFVVGSFAQTPSIAANPKITQTKATATIIPPKPGTMTPSEKLLAVQRTLSTKGKKANSLSGSISLSPNRLWVSKGALLILDNSVRTAGTADGGYAEFQQQPNYAALYFTPPSPGLYLFDVTIEADAKSKVLFFSYGGQAFSSIVTQSKPGHQLFVFDIQKTDYPTEFILTSDSYRWHFYNLEISQIK